MARPIEATPILMGEDARRFMRRIEEERVVSQEDYDRMKKAYEFAMSILEIE